MSVKVDNRRRLLLSWMRTEDRKLYLRANADFIARNSRLYITDFHGFYSVEKCLRDLKALEKEGKVRRIAGRPPLWEVVR